MAKVVITNLDTLVDTAVTTNVNVAAANQAVDTATAKALEALGYADAAESSAVTALGYVSTVQVSAGAAAASALEAQGHSDASQASAVESAGSAVASAASATAAEEDRQAGLLLLAQMVNTYDQFDDRYLGAHLMNPILDNDGQAIKEGALYWNSSTKVFKVYSQSAQVWTPIKDANGSLLLEHNLADLPDKALARTNLGVYSTSEVDTLISSFDEASEIPQVAGTNTYAVGATVQDAINQLDAEAVAQDSRLDTIEGLDSSFSGNKTFNNNVTVTGDFTVNGVTTTVNSTTVTTADNIIVLNNGEIGTGVTAGSAGIQIDRGLATDYQFIFDEVDDTFKIGEIGALQKVATREDTPLDTGVAIWDAATNKFITATTIVGKTLDDISNNIGADHVHYKVRNSNGVLIPKGTVVTAQGTQSGTDYIEIVAVTDPQTQVAIGVVHTDLAVNGTGLVTNTGITDDFVNTSAWAVGTILYPNNSGGFTSTKPTSGMYQACAYVMRQHQTQGTLLVEFSEPKLIASTTQSGYVQLNDTLTSTSTIQALTANQGKVIKDALDIRYTKTEVDLLLDGQDAASEISVAPQGNLSSTTVQSALEELQSDINSMLVDVEW